MFDLIFPQNNEKELFEELKTLGFKEIIFCYTDEKIDAKKIIDDLTLDSTLDSTSDNNSSFVIKSALLITNIKKINNIKAQSISEYAVLMIAVAAAIVAMYVYLNRSVQARFKQIESEINEPVVLIKP